MNIDIKEISALKLLTGLYSEIALLRLKKIRHQVETARLFLQEIAQLYATVKTQALQKGLGGSLPAGRQVSLVLTSNERFFGAITSQMISYFISQVSSLKTDKMVIGKSGIELLHSLGKTSFEPIVFGKDMPSENELAQLFNIIKQYQKVLIFYPQMQTVLKQEPIVLDITQTQKAFFAGRVSKKLAFIFEPEIALTLEFFENQAKMALLHQAFLEAQISQLASRLVTMDEAQNKAEELLKKEQLLLYQSQKSLENRRLLESWISVRGGRHD